MLGHGGAMLHGPVGHKAFQPADAHRFALDTADTFALALGLLGADASADCGQAILGTDGSIGTGVISLTDLRNEVTDGYIHRAAGHARGIFAMQAAGRFILGHLDGVPQGHFLEVGGTNGGILLGHGRFRHAIHERTPPVRRHTCAFSRAWASSARYMRERAMASSQST